jgi:hypothetical protein
MVAHLQIWSSSGVLQKSINLAEPDESRMPFQDQYFSPDRTRVLVSMNHRVSLWNLDKGLEISELVRVTANGNVYAAMSHDGKYAAASSKSELVIVECASGKSVARIAMESQSFICFSPDDTILNGLDVLTSNFWHWEWRKQSAPKTAAKWGYASVSDYSPDGRWYLAMGYIYNNSVIPDLDTRVSISDISSTKQVTSMVCAKGIPKWSNAGSFFAFALGNGDVKLLDVKTKLEQLRPDLSPAKILELNPNGEELATSNPGTLTISSLRSSRRFTMSLESERVECLRYSADGNTVLVGGRQLTLFKRRRPDYSWGVLAIPELWLSAVLAILIIFSIRRDYARKNASITAVT